MESRINDYYGCMMRAYAVKETSKERKTHLFEFKKERERGKN